MTDDGIDPNAQPPAPAAEPQEPPRAQDPPRRGGWDEWKVDLKWATALLFVFVLIVPVLMGALGYSGGYAAWNGKPAGVEDLTNVTEAFFSQGEYRSNLSANGTPVDGASATGPGSLAEPGLVVPFEILSVLLLAALIAGVVIALRDVEGGA